MKKLIILAFGVLIAFQSQAQLDELMAIECENYAKEAAKHLKNTEHPKRGLKAATWMKLGESYLDIAQRCQDDSTAVEKAEKAYQKALELDKQDKGRRVKAIEEILYGEDMGNAYLQQGAGFYNGQNYKKAEQYFKKSSDINTKDTTSALYAGIAAQVNENDNDALKYLQKYIDLGGQDPSIFYTISQIYRTQEKYDEAVSILRKGQAVNPDNQDLPNEMVNVYLASNNIDKAVALLKELVEDDPKNIVNLTNLGIIHDTKAQEYASELAKINNQLSEFNTDRLDRKLVAEQNKLEAYQGEIEALEKRIKTQPRQAATLRKRLEEVNEEKKKIDEEIANITSEIQEKKKQEAEAEGLRVEAKELQSKAETFKNEAVVYYNKVLELDPTSFDALYSLGVIKYNEAVETKRVVDFMDLATYRTEGRAVEDKACAQFKESKPYFERAKNERPDDEIVSETLKNLNIILEQCENQ